MRISAVAVPRIGQQNIDVLGYFTLLVFGSLTVIFTFLLQPWAQDRINGHTAIIPPWNPDGFPKDGLSRWPTDFSRDIIPIMVHSHNDYWRAVPLFSALAAGCIGLIDDRLLYISPLVEILSRQNPHDVFNKLDPLARARGVFDTSPNTTLVLLVEVPCPWNSSETCSYSKLNIWPQPVTVGGTGNLDSATYHANRDWEASDTFVDAPLGVLPTTNKFRWCPGGSSAEMLYYPENSYYASVSFKEAVGDVRLGFSERQLAIVRERIRIARLSKLHARYWDLPSWPIGLRDYVWDVLTREGVGVLSVDDLEAAARRKWSGSGD
ncbi:Altered inheritance of mitochondria protein 6 [Coniosporium tulheliwenetii]|uniref:Altered inheritance of mitochondria protein 6 n=1 Tax=Coniosporium tulheliwenetii TaxID=3383036 RepID=A0ACC2YSU5_9PEZI|nr:Altered inheritance of mitochondria protein 6 [Cladosporium sp. JES 115]